MKYEGLDVMLKISEENKTERIGLNGKVVLALVT